MNRRHALPLAPLVEQHGDFVKDFDPDLYFEEMRVLYSGVAAYLEARESPVVVYTVSIWTDPDAAASELSIDTWESSEAFLARWRGHVPFELGDRNNSPADFAYRGLARIDRHRSIPLHWLERAGPACWDALEPALQTVGIAAAKVLGKSQLHPNAVLGVNGRDHWFQSTYALRAT